MTTLKLEGTDALIKVLKQALTNHKPNEVRSALKRGADIIIQAAKSNVTIDDGGKLVNSIKLLPKWAKDPSGMYVGPRVVIRRTKRTSQKRIDESPFYAHWWEYGTDPHDTSYKGKFVSEAKGTRGQHPGTHAHPYMRPAYDSQGQAALNAAMEDIQKLIESKA